MSSLVEHRLLPEGDPRTQLQTLQREVHNQFNWIRKHETKKLGVDKETYKRFMGIFLASLYVFSPQGRCQGIEDLKFGQVEALLNEGYINTTKFKTQAKWGYQPVTLAEESKELLNIYLRSFRPYAAGPSPSRPTDTLLIDFAGRPHTDIGKELTSFYTKSCNLHITPTRIRSIVETAAEEMYRAGDISLRTRKSVEAINGHTSSTVQNYYLQMDRAADVHSARNFFVQAGSSSEEALPQLQPLPLPTIGEDLDPFGIRVNTTVGTSPSTAASGWAQREGTRHLDWGSSHPEYNRKGVKKVKWSPQELEYVENWMDNDVHGDTNIAASRCLKAIRQDSQAVPIFHAHHILNTTRLRNGFESVIKKKKMQLESYIQINLNKEA